MTEARWLMRAMFVAFDGELIVGHGGSMGLLGDGAVESTLARPKNLYAYEAAALPRLAASYGYGFARNHCFIDGNKRIALTAMAVFLMMNGRRYLASEPEEVAVILDLVSGEVSEDELAVWVEWNSAVRQM